MHFLVLNRYIFLNYIRLKNNLFLRRLCLIFCRFPLNLQIPCFCTFSYISLSYWRAISCGLSLTTIRNILVLFEALEPDVLEGSVMDLELE